MGSRIRQVIRGGVLAATALTLVATGLPVVAAADPGAVSRAKAEVDTLAMEAAALDQQALAAQLRLDEARKRLATREDDVRAQTEKVAATRAQVGLVALAQFQQRDLDPTTQLILKADSESFLSRYATMQQVTANQNGALQDFQAQQANLADMQRGAAADVDTIDGSTAELEKARAASAAKLQDAEAVLARLTAEERARLQAEEERQAREAAAAAERAEVERAQADRTQAERARANPATAGAAAQDSTGQAQTDRSAPGGQNAATSGTSSSRGLAALAFARAQLGKPYSYGGIGPGAFDCSGLTGAAWRSAGVSLPRTSQQQFGVGRAVSIEQLAPGDLVFYYSSISHVALYAGNGQILHASRPGKPIGYDALRSMPIAGARTVG